MFFITSLFAQNSLDSLLNLYNNEQDTSKKIELLDEIVNEAYQYSLDSSIYYKKISVELAKKTNDLELIVNQLHGLAKLYIYNSEYTNAIEQYTNAIPYAKKSGNLKLYALSLHSTGNGYMYKNDFNTAVEYYQKALIIREQINDTIGLAATTNNIGLIYWKLKQYDLALPYYRQSLNYEILAQNYAGIAASYNNIGMLYWKTNEIDSAIIYLRKGLNIRVEKNIDRLTFNNTYNNLGILYRHKGIYDSALYFFKKTLEIDKIIQDKHNLANTYTNIGTTYLYLNNSNKSIKYLDSALAIAKLANDYEILRNIYDVLAEFYALKNRYKEAYQYLRLHLKYKDSVYTADLANQITEMQTKFETERKEQEILLQKKEIELQSLTIDKKNAALTFQKKMLYAFISFSIIVLLLLIFLARLFFQKRKANKLLHQKNTEIMQQKEEIETQANTLSDAFEKIRKNNEELVLKNEQIELQRQQLKEKNEFVESSIRYASSIQNASLPLISEIDKYFENYIIFLPKDIVSGDFYFFSRVSKDNTENLFFVVADCTGHGVPGAFMSMIGIRLLNKYVNEEKLDSPAEILKNIDKDIVATLKQEQRDNQDGMDMVICKFTAKNGKNLNITYAGAKRPLYYYSNSNNKIERIAATRKSIGGGISNNPKIFKDITMDLEKDSRFYLFSDGILDQNNKKRIRFGTHKLIRILETTTDKPIEKQGSIVFSELKEWQADESQRDDITFVALKLKSVFKT